MDKNTRHKNAMEKQKAAVDDSIAKADVERGVAVLLTGDGKGKTSSAFGMVMRALGYHQTVGIVQFIKGVQASGEEIFVKEQLPGVSALPNGHGLYVGHTRSGGGYCRRHRTWEHASTMLSDPGYDLVVLDELTYMLAFDYLPEADVIAALTQRPETRAWW